MSERAAPNTARALGERFVDLHAHSTASDGARSPEELVAAAARAQLAAVALTDHDTMDGVPAAVAAGAQVGVRVVPGVELSTMDGEREVHVLGLHVARNTEMDAHLATFQSSRRDRAEQIVAVLNGMGVPVTLERVLAIAGDGAIGRPHVARALIEGGWVRDFREAFDRFLGNGRPAAVPKHRISVADGIALIHRSGGLAVLAHPGPEGTRERVAELVPLGLDGLEVRHPGHSADDVARLGALVAHFGLIASGGSDWHGAADGPRALGGQRVPLAWLDAQDDRLTRPAAPGRVA